MLDENTRSLLQQAYDALGQVLNQSGGGPFDDSDLPSDDERRAMNYQREQQAIQYSRDHGGATIPPEMNIPPKELNAAILVSERRKVPFDTALRLVRGKR